jgi:hypothetical protein
MLFLIPEFSLALMYDTYRKDAGTFTPNKPVSPSAKTFTGHGQLYGKLWKRPGQMVFVKL